MYDSNESLFAGKRKYINTLWL